MELLNYYGTNFILQIFVWPFHIFTKSTNGVYWDFQIILNNALIKPIIKHDQEDYFSFIHKKF